MAYCSQAEILVVLGEVGLWRLAVMSPEGADTDDHSADLALPLTVAYVAEAIARGDAQVDGALAPYYVTPVTTTPVPAALRRLAVDAAMAARAMVPKAAVVGSGTGMSSGASWPPKLESSSSGTL